jgi:hypothetical protein
LWLALGPVPLSLAVVAAVEERAEEVSPARGWLILLAVWCAVGSAAVIGLGAVGGLTALWLSVVMGGLGAAGLVVLRRRGGRSLRPLLLPTRRLRISEALTLGALVSLGLALLFRICTEPVTDYDSLAYHLLAVAQWVQTGTLARMGQYADANSLYPFSWEALCTVFVLPFREDYVAVLPNLAAWVMLGLGIYCLSRELGATRESGLAAGAAALSMPDVLENVCSLHVDLAMAAFFVAALVFCVRYARVRTPGYFGLLLVGLGGMAGAKTSGLIYGAVAAVALVVCLLPGVVTRLGQPRERGSSRWVVGFGLVCALLVGGYWYGRNLMELGNPVAPVTVQVGRHVIFPGAIAAGDLKRTTMAGLFNPREAVDRLILGREISEHLSWPLYALAAMAAVGMAPDRKRRRVRSAHLAAVWSLVGLTAYLYAVTPYGASMGQWNWQVTAWIGQALRYGYPCCGVLAVAGALGASKVGLPRGVLLTVSLGAAVLGLQRVGAMAMLIAVPACWAGLHLIQRPSDGGDGRVRFDGGMAALVVCVGLPALVFGSYLARLWRDQERVVLYGEIVRVVPMLVKRDETIGCPEGPLTYLLCGTDLSRRVVPLRLRTLRAEAWRRYLREHRIDVVAVGPASSRGSSRALVEWLGSKESPLVCIFGDPAVGPALYRLKEASRGKGRAAGGGADDGRGARRQSGDSYRTWHFPRHLAAQARCGGQGEL